MTPSCEKRARTSPKPYVPACENEYPCASPARTRTLFRTNDHQVFDLLDSSVKPSCKLSRIIQQNKKKKQKQSQQNQQQFINTLQDVNSDAFELVLRFCYFHTSKVADSMTAIEKNDWNNKFVSSSLPSQLCAVASAAFFLEVDTLTDVTCRAIADAIKGKSPEQIRATFDIPNDIRRFPEPAHIQRARKRHSQRYNNNNANNNNSNNNNSNTNNNDDDDSIDIDSNLNNNFLNIEDEDEDENDHLNLDSSNYTKSSRSNRHKKNRRKPAPVKEFANSLDGIHNDTDDNLMNEIQNRNNEIAPHAKSVNELADWIEDAHAQCNSTINGNNNISSSNNNNNSNINVKKKKRRKKKRNKVSLNSDNDNDIINLGKEKESYEYPNEVGSKKDDFEDDSVSITVDAIKFKESLSLSSTSSSLKPIIPLKQEAQDEDEKVGDSEDEVEDFQKDNRIIEYGASTCNLNSVQCRMRRSTYASSDDVQYKPTLSPSISTPILQPPSPFQFDESIERSLSNRGRPIIIPESLNTFSNIARNNEMKQNMELKSIHQIDASNSTIENINTQVALDTNLKVPTGNENINIAPHKEVDGLRNINGYDQEEEKEKVQENELESMNQKEIDGDLVKQFPSFNISNSTSTEAQNSNSSLTAGYPLQRQMSSSITTSTTSTSISDDNFCSIVLTRSSSSHLFQNENASLDLPPLQDWQQRLDEIQQRNERLDRMISDMKKERDTGQREADLLLARIEGFIAGCTQTSKSYQQPK